MSWNGPLEKIDDYRWKIPRSYKECMNGDAVIFADEKMIKTIISDNSPEQAANVACLPGLVGRSMAMPDIHWGYGFPIGGVAAMDAEEGVISPGGIGFDINCGVRLITTNLGVKDVTPKIKQLITPCSRTFLREWAPRAWWTSRRTRSIASWRRERSGRWPKATVGPRTWCGRKRTAA